MTDTPKKIAVLIHTTRGGKDPDDFYHVVTEELADELNNDDAWRDLGPAETAKDPRILGGYIGSRAGAIRLAEDAGYEVEPEDFDAVGY